MKNSWTAATDVGWHPEVIRLTAFPAEQIEGSGWWDLVAGRSPDEVTAKPRDGYSQYSGEFRKGTLTLTLLPDRIDWRLTADEGESGANPDLLGGLAEEIGEFLEVVAPWYHEAPSAHRLAFGCVLLREVDSREAGYEALDALLPAVDLDPGSSDFQYRINRRRRSSADDRLSVNRLSNWSVLSRTALTVGAHGIHEAAATKPWFACRLELDVNTVPEPELLIPADSFARIAHELSDLAAEIAERGDVP